MSWVIVIFYFFVDYFLIGLLHIRSLLIRKPPSKWKQGTLGDVLLIQGFFEKWSFISDLGNYINLLGFRVHIVRDLGICVDKIEQEATCVQNYIQKNKLQEITIIGYSKGGLIGTYLLSFTDKKTIKKILTIATPLNGSVFGRIPMMNLQQMALNSLFLHNLHRKLKVSNKIVSYRAARENFVIPTVSSNFTGIKNVEIPVVGHTRILYSKVLKAEIKKELLA